MDLREQILTSADARSELVDIPEWGVKVEVRGMSGRLRARLFLSGTNSLEKSYPEIIIGSTYDPETGKQGFEPADRDAIFDKDSQALERIVTAALRLSGLGAAATDGGDAPFPG